MISNTLVLAAGLGSRIRAVAGDLPKPLVRFGDRPILLHNLLWLQRSGIANVWVNLHFGASKIREAIRNCSDLNLDVSFSEEPELLGTAGAVSNIPAMHSGRSLVVYGDNVLKMDLDRMITAHLARGAYITISLFDQARNAHTGIAGGRVVVDESGDISAFIEGAPSASGLVNAGVYIIEPSVVSNIGVGRFSDFGKDIFPALLKVGCPIFSHVIEPDGFCLGLDTPESFAAGLDLLQSGRISLR